MPKWASWPPKIVRAGDCSGSRGPRIYCTTVPQPPLRRQLARLHTVVCCTPGIAPGARISGGESREDGRHRLVGLEPYWRFDRPSAEGIHQCVRGDYRSRRHVWRGITECRRKRLRHRLSIQRVDGTSLFALRELYTLRQ